ncbi:hypothetical protein ACFQZ4_05960 [Catellatospora coxensis]
MTTMLWMTLPSQPAMNRATPSALAGVSVSNPSRSANERTLTPR